MLRAITVDDEFSNHLLLKRLVEEGGQVEVVAQFTNPLSLLEQVDEIKPDVAFVDIEMPVMSGLELVERVLSICPDLEIVFVTAFSHYAVEAFHVNALDYLLKPVDSQEVERVIEKLIKTMTLKATPIAIEVSAPVEACRILCLGEFEVYGTVSGRPVQWLTSKVEELLAYLLMHPGKRVNKGELCEALWPGSDYEKALMNLYTTIYRLRKTTKIEGVPLLIKSDKDGYQIDTEGCIIDYKEFERLTQGLNKESGTDEPGNEIENLVNAEAVYQGELFANKAYLWSASYSEGFNQAYRMLCYRLAAHFMAQGALEQSAGYLINLLARFPDEEKACLLLMDIYGMQEDRPAIEKLYDVYTRYLAEEMNVSTSPQFKEHYDSLLS